ncbi:hypothetical protein [Peterkaempfera griseoplana]|uniref:hypothetical protein n=1 Tax=Peterkaempfera griseoplana TaxID=66896 RepID=UPI0006E242AD|nr:hypothetical protein [Peterkaempfera griseoplana]
MAQNRNRDPRPALVASAASAPAGHLPGTVFPLPRRHRRLLAATATAAALLLGTLSAGAVVQVHHDPVSAAAATADR